jgi:hypothetical protein
VCLFSWIVRHWENNNFYHWVFCSVSIKLYRSLYCSALYCSGALTNHWIYSLYILYTYIQLSHSTWACTVFKNTVPLFLIASSNSNCLATSGSMTLLEELQRDVQPHIQRCKAILEYFLFIHCCVLFYSHNLQTAFTFTFTFKSFSRFHLCVNLFFISNTNNIVGYCISSLYLPFNLKKYLKIATISSRWNICLSEMW